jgi:hypothetical protein
MPGGKSGPATLLGGLTVVRTAFITIAATSEGYEARLDLDGNGMMPVRDDAPRVSFKAPSPPPGHEDFPGFMLATSDASADFHKLGQKLYDLLISGKIRAALAEAREKQSVRLLLRFKAAELNAIPWELMRDGPGRVFTDANHPVARAAGFFDPGLALPEKCWPLRVLLVVGSEDIDAEKEIYHVRDAFREVCGLVGLEVLRLPTALEVREKCRDMRPHVFHFLGHGAVDHRGGYLKLDQKAGGGAKPWTASDIKDALDEGRPRLVILNACQSGVPGEQKGTWAVAEGLAQLKVPAVISMQGPIRDVAAERFAKGLYEALAAGDPLDVAMARARLAIIDEFSDDRREYALPYLILGAPPERILDLSPDPRVQLVREPLRQTRYFVDRTVKRRRLWQRLCSGEAGTPRMYAITGPPQAGKGSLLRWCLGVASVCGHSVAHVSFDGDEDVVGSGKFLERLAAALPPSVAGPVHGSLNDFVAHLRRFAANRAEEHAAGRPYTETPRPLYDEIRGILAAAEADLAVMIGIEGVDRIERGEWLSCAVPGLIEPIARGDVGQVRLIVTLPEGEYSGRFSPRDFTEADVEEINLPLFPATDLAELASQKLRAQGYSPRNFQSWIQKLCEENMPSLDTYLFEMLDRTAKMAGWRKNSD